jgi:hypothetical protein
MADREYRVIYKAVADFADLIKQSKLAEDRLRAMQGAQEVDRKSLRDLDNYTDAVEEVGKAAADATDSLGDLREEQDKGADSSKEAAKAHKQETSALQAVARAEAEATRAAQSSNKTSAERIRLLLEQKRAQAEMRAGLEKMPRAWGRDEDAAKESARATRDASQATETHVKKVLSLRTALKYLTADMVSLREEQEKVSEETDHDSNMFSRLAQRILHMGRSADTGSGALHRMTTALRGSSGSSDNARSALQKLGEGFRNFGAIFKGLGLPTLILVFGKTAVAGITALGGAVAVLVQSLSQLGPLLASAPGGILAIAQAALGAKLAIGQVTNAMKLYQSEQKKEGPQTFADALKEMSPATRQFTKDLVKLTDQWGKVKKGVSQAFFSQFVKDMDRVKTLIPTVSALLERGAASAGKFVDKALKQFSSPEWKKSLTALSKSGARVMGSLGDTLLLVADGFRKIAVAARPLTEWLAGRFKELAGEFSDWTDALNEGSFTKAQTRFNQFVTIIKNFGSIIKSVFIAASETTDWFMERFTAMSSAWATATRDAARQGGGLKKFFDDLKPVLSETAGLFGDLFVGLGKSLDMGSLTRIISMLRDDLVPAVLSLVNSWGDAGIVEDWVKALTQAVEIFAKMSDAGFFSGMFVIMAILTDFLEIINSIIDTQIGSFFLGIAGAIAKVVAPIMLLNKAFQLHLLMAALVGKAQTALGLANTATQAGAATRAISGLSSAMSKMLSPMGLLATAIIGVGIYGFSKLLDDTKAKAREAALSVDELTASLRDTGTAFALQTTDVKKPWWAGGDLDKTTASLSELAQYFGDTSLRDNISNFFNTEEYGGGIAGAELYEETLKNVTEAIKQLALSDPEAAGRQVQILQDALEGKGKSAEYIESVIGPLKEIVASASDARVQVQAFVDELEATTPAQNMTEALSRYEEALDSVTAAIENNGKTATNHGRELDLSTEAGRDNERQLDNLAQSAKALTAQQIKQGESTSDIMKKTKQAREDFIKAARQMGLNKKAAKDLADEYGLIPSHVRTELETRNYDQVMSNLARLKENIQGLDGFKIDIGINAPRVTYRWVPTDPKHPNKGGSLVPDHTPITSADGGYIRGEGTNTSDSIPAWLSDQEYVIRAAAVKKYGVGLFNALNSMRYSDGGIVGYKIGGKVKKGAKAPVQAKGKAKGMSIPTDVVEGVQKRREEFQSAKAAALDNKNELAQARENLRNAQQALAEATDKEAQQLRIDESAKNLRNAEAELAEAEYDLANGISVKAAELERDEAYAAYQSALEDQTNRISVGRAEVDLKQAQESAADALEDFENNISVGAAQVNLAQAEEEYRQALTDAATGLSVRGAQADVNSAEENYRKVMASAASSEAEKMQARQALEEARAQVADTAMQTELRLMEAQQGRVEAEDMLGDTEAEVALRVLETAQAQKEAEQNLTDTQREVDLRVRETAQTYDASVRNVATVGREVQNRVIEARTGLVEARRADRLLPGQIAEEERQARLGLSQAESGLKDTKVQNRKDNETWNEQLTKYGKRDAAAGFTKKNWRAYKESVPKGKKATNKGFGEWLKKNGPYARDQFGDLGVFNSGAARSDAWADYREEKSLYKDVNGSIEAPSTNMEALANYMEGRVGDEVGANTCLANVHKALDDVGARLGLGSANNTASTSGRASDVREWLQSKGLLRDGEPPRGAILVWMDRNHIAIADGHGNAINNWDGSKVEKTPLSKMGSYKWTYPASLWTGNQGRRVGGTVKANQPYTVGEVGQELFVPDVNGRILTAAQTAKMLAAASGNPSFGVSMGLPGMNPALPQTSTPQVNASALAAGAATVARFGDINVYNPVPERASDSLQKRVKILTNREA